MEQKTIIDLDAPLMNFGNGHGVFSVRDSLNGICITGSVGSGKSTGSGANFAQKFLLAGYGGLVLTCKPSDRGDWVRYCTNAGRLSDLVIIEPRGKHRFNWLEYISQGSNGDKALTENIVDVINTVIRAEEDKQGQSDDQFWDSSLTTLIGMVVDLSLTAYNKVSVDLLYSIAQTLPRPEAPAKKDAEEPKEQTAFERAYQQAVKNINAKVDAWKEGFPDGKPVFADRESYEDALFEVVPEARLFNYVAEYFWNSFRFLSPKTRSLVEFMFSGFLYTMLRDPVYSLFCKGETTIKPEDCFEGKIILLALPIKVYNKVGRMCQTLFKYIWQQAVEKRIIDKFSRPVFLWIDEAQNTIHQKDNEFLQTARGSRVSSVFLTQCLPNYYAALGGERSKSRVDSLLACLTTKVIHCNNCVTTNNWASELVGDEFQADPSINMSMNKDSFSQGQNMGVKLQRVYRPEKFAMLKIGGKNSGFTTEAVVVKQGDPIYRNSNHAIITFKQIF